MGDDRELCSQLKTGGRVWFVGERMPYTVQARDERYIICTKPFAARKTVIYSVIDTEEMMRGPDNTVFGGGYETPADCQERLREFNDPEIRMELSHRRKCKARIFKTEAPTIAIEEPSPTEG